PLFAQVMHGVLHPVSLAAAFLAPHGGLDPVLVAHVMLAALGAGVLARRLGASLGAAAVAGFAYGLSGYVLGMTSILAFLAGAATAPWLVAGLHAAATGARRGVAAAALAVAVMAFAGDPQWLLVAGALGAVLALEAGGGRGLARAAAGVGVGGALSAIQLLPAAVGLGESVRMSGLTAADRVQWALSQWRLVELVAPGFFAGVPGETLAAPVFLRLGGRSIGGLPFVPSVFIGAVVLVLAVAGTRASRTGRVLAAGSLLFLWLALGHHLGAEQLLHAVPVWGLFRYAEKLVGPLTLCVAMLAALGTDRLRAAPRQGLAAAFAALVPAAIGLVFAATPAAATALAWAGAGDAAPLAREHLVTGLLQAVTALALLAGLFFLARRSAWGARHLSAALAGLVFLQMVAASPYALHSGSRAAREPSPLASLVNREQVTRIAHPLAPVPGVAAPGLDAVDRDDAAASRSGEVPFSAASGVGHLDSYSGLSPRRLKSVLGAFSGRHGMRDWKGLRRFGTTHLVAHQPSTQLDLDVLQGALAGSHLAHEDRELGFEVWAVPHRPWASFAAQTVPAGSEEEAVRALAGVGRRGGSEIVLEGPQAPGLAPGRVLAFERRPELVRVEAEAEGDAVLVVNDAWWPGWTATVDGRPAPIWRADALVRAVPWPAGRHVLEMRYEPPEVRRGFAISAFTAAALTLVPLAGVIRRRAARRGAAAAKPAPR
ncbi:MAG: hypothetical protein ACYC8T_21565, partial [Myxococcaceae bacterium]